MKPWTETQLNQLLRQVIDEATAIKIPVSRHISPTLHINSRTKARFGGCKKVKGFVHCTYQIEISKMLMEAEVTAVKEILAHEILHSCPASMNHGATWKRHCQEMEKAYGYKLQRTSTYQSLGIEDPRKERNYQYVIECNRCGQRILRQRRSPLTDETNKYRCRCGGKLVCSSLARGE